MRFYLVQEFRDNDQTKNTCLTSLSNAKAFVEQSYMEGNVVVLDINLNKVSPEILVSELLEEEAANMVKIADRMEVLTFELFLDEDHPNRIKF